MINLPEDLETTKSSERSESSAVSGNITRSARQTAQEGLKPKANIDTGLISNLSNRCSADEGNGRSRLTEKTGVLPVKVATKTSRLRVPSKIYPVVKSGSKEIKRWRFKSR